MSGKALSLRIDDTRQRAPPKPTYIAIHSFCASLGVNCGMAASAGENVCWRCNGAKTVQHRPSKRQAKRDRAAQAHDDGETAPAATLRVLQTRQCPVCDGAGRIERKRASKDAIARAKRVKQLKPLKQFASWIASGPEPAHDVLRFRRGVTAPDASNEAVSVAAIALPDDCAWDPLVGKWVIAQPIARHRYSTDDVVVAWEAFRVAHTLQTLGADGSGQLGAGWRPTCVDIGCGLGSVLMMLQWMLPDARSVGIEAQPTRLELARKSIIANGCSCRCKVMHGDLRSEDVAVSAAEAVSRLLRSGAAVPDHATGGAAESSGSAGTASDTPSTAVFDIVTGTPPYFDPAVLGQPADVESSACLFETRGGIEAYCAAARRLIRPAGQCPLGLAPAVAAAPVASPPAAAAAATCAADVASCTGPALPADKLTPNATTSRVAIATASLHGVDCDGEPLAYPPRPDSALFGLPGARVTAVRKPMRNDSASSARPAAWWQVAGGRFVVVETALAAGRCYHAAAANELVVERRLDLVGREGKEALICVLVMARAEEHTSDLLAGAAGASPSCGPGRLSSAVYGEEVIQLTVRGPPPAAARTAAYRRLLAEMGKPSD